MKKTLGYCVLACACILFTIKVPTASGFGAMEGGGDGDITYQGRLLQNGEPANGVFDMTFDMYDAEFGGNRISSVDVLDVPVTDGLFTARLNYPVFHLNGERRWLQIEINKTEISPRQEITHTPYALQTRGFYVDENEVIRIERTTGDAVLELESGDPIFRTASLRQELDGDFTIKLPQLGAFRILHNNGSSALALLEDGRWGLGTDNAANEANFEMRNDNNMLKVFSINGTPLIAETTNGNAAIIEARSAQETEFHVNSFEGRFAGNLNVVGQLSKGSGSFKIDHPLDPENMYLSHSFVESPDMMNVYNGNIVLNEDGEAIVEMPEYFETLNRDFRYQLTCIGGYAQVYIAEEVKDNQFIIAGGKLGLIVSWQVTGVRCDPFAELHRIQVETEKPELERGKYLHAEAYESLKQADHASGEE